MQVKSGKTYVGVVEDCEDPKKIGRVKVRVFDVFDDVKLIDIPWANPWKDLSGNEFSVPEKGKVVTVVFENDDPNSPEFISSDHYNINLEKKLNTLSGNDYLTMKSILFDHKTQIYVNDSEGLKIDHKYNNLNITENTIDLNLKDNNRILNIGDSSANQQALLGNNWFDWFDSFVDNLLKSPYLDSSGAPVTISPSMANVLLDYKSLKNNFLSKHVNIVDNDKIKTVLNSSRENTSQYGDNWNSTISENKMTEIKKENFDPEKPKDIDPNIELVITYLETKGYEVKTDIGILNILAIRNKENGIISNKFDDNLKVVWKKEDGSWNILEAPITTVPGFIVGLSELDVNEKLLSKGQYVNSLELFVDKNDTYLYFKECLIHENNEIKKYSWKSEKVKYSGVKIIPANKSGVETNVFEIANNGSQVFKSITHFNSFIDLCKEQVNKYNTKTFTYTLCDKSDFDKINK